VGAIDGISSVAYVCKQWVVFLHRQRLIYGIMSWVSFCSACSPLCRLFYDDGWLVMPTPVGQCVWLMALSHSCVS